LKVEQEDIHSRDAQARAELEKLGHRHTEEQNRQRTIERMYQLFTADYRALTDGVEVVGRPALTVPMRLELDQIDAFARESSNRKIAEMDEAAMEVRLQTIKELIRELGKRKREIDEEGADSEDDGSYQDIDIGYGDSEEEVEGEEEEGEDEE
jgi:hypothetical protein